MSAGPRILVVDDEPQILRALRTSLRAAGYVVETADTAQGALAEAAMRPPDAVILDLILPDGTGTEVCREFRTWSSAPVIVLSAVGDEHEKIAALDAGADDYVTKPVGIDELLARLRASLRRVTPTGEPVVEIGDLVVDLEKRLVTIAGEEVHLTPHQFDILRVLAKNEGKLMTHRSILREVWGPGLWERVEPAPRPHVAAPAEDRAGPGAAALPRHRARSRLPAREPRQVALSARERGGRRPAAGAGPARRYGTTRDRSQAADRPPQAPRGRAGDHDLDRRALAAQRRDGGVHASAGNDLDGTLQVESDHPCPRRLAQLGDPIENPGGRRPDRKGGRKDRGNHDRHRRIVGCRRVDRLFERSSGKTRARRDDEPVWGVLCWGHFALLSE